ncbi:hypothetical protein BN159_7471 [Streptomyces davaonensis JCM 4913]|uniref:Uncharacterized protein n=1 Tax=Streptomyces davaonensis (strain DSM 101723 / JCM 4913 / KCC S-0913 / 768) TaxID=1214101 RepID=K4REF0_STRDJ|nr:DUF6397 family protein [Streptomyces davaonensis]CCK31850.1 hypothetical protein BN159_7471 [Streptomyces davaonensis JCM 4913]
MTGDTITPPRGTSCTPGHAARELGLKRREFDLAVHLGHIRTVPGEGGGGHRRVTRLEIERVRASKGFPDTLLERVRTVGTTEGAAVMDVPPGRFTRLARLGLVVPVAFYLNRYRAVVWMYLADELRQFASDEKNAPLLKARTPEGLRDQLDAGLDLRPRNWRGRHLGFLLRQTDDPWQQAGAVAAFLDPVQIAELVPDPYERSHLNRFRPGPPGHGAPGSPAARRCEQIMTADDADETAWLRADLTRLIEEARTHRPAPRPTAHPSTRVHLATPAHLTTPPPAASTPESGEHRSSHRLFGWLRRRSA